MPRAAAKPPRKDFHMTLHEVCTQLHKLSLGGFFNGEKFTRQELESYVSRMMRNPEGLQIPNTLVMEICLPDGRWLFTIEKYKDEFGYFIPETREQESRLAARLTGQT